MMENKNYDQRVLEIAEEMIQTYKDEVNYIVSDQEYDELMESAILLASITVKHMRAIASEAWFESRQSWFSEIGELEEGETAFINEKAFMMECGLIPSPENNEG